MKETDEVLIFSHIEGTDLSDLYKQNAGLEYDFKSVLQLGDSVNGDVREDALLAWHFGKGNALRRANSTRKPMRRYKCGFCKIKISNNEGFCSNICEKKFNSINAKSGRWKIRPCADCGGACVGNKGARCKRCNKIHIIRDYWTPEQRKKFRSIWTIEKRREHSDLVWKKIWLRKK